MVRLLIFVLFINTLLAQDQEYLAQYDKDSGLFISHQIKSGQTLFGLTQHFGSDMEATLELNETLDLTNLSQNQEIQIKLNPELFSNTPPTEIAHARVSYIVKPGQTLYSISRIYLNRDVTEIMKLNNLNSYNIHPADTLLIGFVETPSIEPIIADQTERNELEETLITNHEFLSDLDTTSFETKVIPREQIKEKGLAYWQSISNFSDEYIVLHKSAPINQPIILYNPMMDRMVEATVVAPLPEKSYPDNISIVISPAVADALGALDKRFIVEMTY